MKHYSFLQEIVGTSLALASVSSVFMTRRIIIQKQIAAYVKKLQIALYQQAKTREQAKKIIEHYCYSIALYTDKQLDKLKQKQVNKLKKKNFHAKQYCINNLMIPLNRILENQNDHFWKKSLMDYLDNDRMLRFSNNLSTSIFSAIGIGMLV